MEINKENVSSPDEMNNLMDAIFELLKTDENPKDFDNLLLIFKALKENEKDEIIEGIKKITLRLGAIEKIILFQNLVMCLKIKAIFQLQRPELRDF